MSTFNIIDLHQCWPPSMSTLEIVENKYRTVTMAFKIKSENVCMTMKLATDASVLFGALLTSNHKVKLLNLLNNFEFLLETLNCVRTCVKLEKERHTYEFSLFRLLALKLMCQDFFQNLISNPLKMVNIKWKNKNTESFVGFFKHIMFCRMKIKIPQVSSNFNEIMQIRSDVHSEGCNATWHGICLLLIHSSTLLSALKSTNIRSYEISRYKRSRSLLCRQNSHHGKKLIK